MIRFLKLLSAGYMSNHVLTGPVTDYSATVLHWMRDRAPNYRGGYTGERERPSASYIVDVRIA